jgi:hypothetical protein
MTWEHTPKQQGLRTKTGHTNRKKVMGDVKE